MLSHAVHGVRLAGVASAVPAHCRAVAAEAGIFGADEVARVSQASGVSNRHVVNNGICASDLCLPCAERVLAELGWERESIGLLLFVSQTPDYILPATACTLHARLGLSRACAAFDVALGCSGYTYGLWLASSLLAAGAGKRALVLVGDTISRLTSPHDRSVALLFGDAGTATALESEPGAPPLFFALGTDGSGAEHLMVPAGGFRHPRTGFTPVRTVRENGNVRSDEDVFMNGGEIFAFTIKTVPAVIQSALQSAGWAPADVDAFVFHQANRFMLQHLAKRLRIPDSKLVLTLEDFGNTSSASIPLSMTVGLRERLSSTPLRLVLAGFGVGFSWGSMAVTCGPMAMPELFEVGGAAQAAEA